MAIAAIVETVHQWAHTGLLWIGFGTVVGLLAKTVMPGKDQVDFNPVHPTQPGAALQGGPCSTS